MKHFHVAAGILRDAAGRVLIAERLCDGPFEGLWEFPGGKISKGESATDALRRELTEELGIVATAMHPFTDLRHEYPDRTVELAFFFVDEWQGKPSGLEGQQIRWVTIPELDSTALLPADKPIVDLLQRRADKLTDT